jgi:hypothetical protein
MRGNRWVAGLICIASAAHAACEPQRNAQAADAGEQDVAAQDAEAPKQLDQAQREACMQLAAAQCADPAACQRVSDGDADSGRPGDSCAVLAQAQCEAIFALPGVLPDPAGPLLMAAAILRRGCLEKWAVEGEWRGSLTLDAGCIRDEQCASGVCVTNGDKCGKCKPLLAAARAPGESCGDSATGRLHCRADSLCMHAAWETPQVGICQLRGTLGSSCDSSADDSCVADDLMCSMNTCVARVAPQESCDPAQDACDSGLTCDATTERCRPTVPHNLEIGATCPRFPATANCEDGLYCALPDGVDRRVYDGPGTCQAFAYLHEPCGAGHDCYYGLTCSAGMCEPFVTLGRRDPSDPVCQKLKT